MKFAQSGALLLGAAALQFAQEGGGRLVGTVTDPSGAVLPGVAIMVLHKATGLTRSTTTENSGDYVFPSLPIGRYDVTASQQGFATQHSTGVEISVGSPTRLDLELQVAGVAQEVTVQSRAPLLNTESGAGGVLLNSSQVTNLPLNGRNFLQLVTLQTGVRLNTAAGRLSFTINGAPPHQGINFLVDGTDGTGIETAEIGGIFAAPGQSTFSLSLDSISEFVVHANNFSVRYGRAMGGVIETVTKSGTNDVHGNVFYFLRNSAFNANSIQANSAGLARVPLRFNQFGGNAGGPILRNKLFFWTGYEGVRRRSGLANTFTVLSDAGRAKVTDPAIARFVNDVLPRANQPPTSNPDIALLVRNDTQTVREDIGTIRMDYNISSKDTFFARYNIHDTEGARPLLATPKNDTRIKTRQQIGTLSHTHIFGPTTTLNLRTGVNRPVNDSDTTGADPAVNLGGLFSVAADFLYNHATSYTFAGDLTILQGKHTWSLGHEYRTTRINRTQWNAPGYQYLAGAAQLDNFFRNNPDQFVSQNVNAGNSGSSGSLGTYVEDSIKLSRKLTFVLGLRYDYFFIPSEKYGRMVGVLGSPFPLSQIQFKKPGERVIDPDYSGFGPRLSFAYSPTTKMVIRGGYGVFVGQNYPALTTAGSGTYLPPIIPTELFDPDYRLRPITFLRGDVPNMVYPNISFVTKEALLKNSPPLAVSLSNPDWNNSYTHQWSLRAERELSQSTRFSVGYVGTRSRRIIGEDTFNLIRPLQGNTRENPLFNTMMVRGSLNNADFNSMHVSLSQRMTRGMQFNVHYTWSHSIDDIFGFSDNNNPGITPQNASLQQHRGHSAFDVRHDLKADYYYDLPLSSLTALPRPLRDGWNLGGITRISAGTPFTAVTGTNVGDGVHVQRPDVGCEPRTGAEPGLFVQVLKLNCLPRPTVRDPETGYVFGNLGRNTFFGPSFVNFDFTVQKNTRITERITHQFRVEFFNIFNNTNFQTPVSAINNPNFGRILGAGPGREIQFAMKLIF